MYDFDKLGKMEVEIDGQRTWRAIANMQAVGLHFRPGGACVPSAYVPVPVLFEGEVLQDRIGLPPVIVRRTEPPAGCA